MAALAAVAGCGPLSCLLLRSAWYRLSWARETNPKTEFSISVLPKGHVQRWGLGFRVGGSHSISFFLNSSSDLPKRRALDSPQNLGRSFGHRCGVLICANHNILYCITRDYSIL